MPSYNPDARPLATPTAARETVDGSRLAAIVRALDAPGRLHLAQQILAGRIALGSLTPQQICDVCRVPGTHRKSVLRATIMKIGHQQ
jgi:hypothetical protein